MCYRGSERERERERETERERLPDLQQTSKTHLMGKPTSKRVSEFES